MKRIFSEKTKGPDKAYPICMDSIQGTEGPKKDWDEHAEDKFDRCVDKVKDDEKDMKDGDPCWKGYEMVGKKKKDGKEVPNCVPKKSSVVFDALKKKAELETELHNDELAQKLQRFESLVSNHDLTYQYTDDFRQWQKGSQEYKEIINLKKELEELGAGDKAVAIWNAYVDQKLVPEARDRFYWK